MVGDRNTMVVSGRIDGRDTKFLVADGKIYATCPNCGKLVRIDKPILGDLHICC